MEREMTSFDIKRFSWTGVLITLGIVFGNLATSPLYAMKSIIAGGADNFSELLIYGGVSSIFWTLTILTTIKYIIITLRYDNNGEGGIFSLFALIKDKSEWVALATMLGAAALLADGVMTPSITVTSSIEGLKLYNPNIEVVPIVVLIMILLFAFQRYGSYRIGQLFGPVMVLWLLVLSVFGAYQICENPMILKAFSPIYCYRFMTEYPGAFVLLSAVFLCVTGAETIYADLGHCGKKNIQITWIFVKIALILNYFGQGAWILNNMDYVSGINPFFEMIPSWFLIPCVIIATATAIIASQAIITGSFTMIGEAISLNFWPKMRIQHPTMIRGQVYLPFVNWFLWIACTLVVIIFRESDNMSTAYGLSINLAEVVTTVLLSYYLLKKGVNHRIVILLFSVYFSVEICFLLANLTKFRSGGWVTIMIAVAYLLVMIGWFFGRKIKNRYISFEDLDEYLDMFRDIVKDESIPRFATNLVYVIRANKPDQVESKVIYSIFKKQPKRADTYWLLHVDRVSDPNSFDYKIQQVIPGVLIRIDFHIGFKVEPKINLYFKEVVEDMERNGEIELKSSYDTLRKYNFDADFRFILIERIMSRDVKLSTLEDFILSLNNLVRRVGVSDLRSLNLDPTTTLVEQVPIIVDQPQENRIERLLS